MRTCSTESRPRRRSPFYLSLMILGFGTILLLVLAGCGHQEEPINHPLVVDKGYLGNDACMDCHKQAFEQHKKSHHAMTIRQVNAESMGKFMPKTGPLKGTDIEIYDTVFGPAMGWKGKPESMLPMQYALGSERFGFTFIQLEDDRNIIELRESFYPQSHKWSQTPGYEFMAKDSIGQRREGVAALRCLSCHVTALPTTGITPEPRFFGVGCESCHGPGKKHVDAVQAGEKNLYMAKLGSLGAKQLNELCGRCHRTEKDLQPADMNMTQRFAPYGLMKSRCFLESGDTLSCLTCHEPHKDASTDHKGYEQACLKCHASSQSVGPSHVKQKACPVNPRSGCIPCHMPKTKPTPDSQFTMSEHYIRSFSSEELKSQEPHK